VCEEEYQHSKKQWIGCSGVGSNAMSQTAKLGFRGYIQKLFL